jgi:hypothetical protein
MGEWIKFVEVDLRDGRKTKVWAVMTIDGSECLGRIGWYSSWRRYCFIVQLAADPRQQFIFEQDCLRRIADFVERKTRQHKSRLLEAKGGKGNG